MKSILAVIALGIFMLAPAARAQAGPEVDGNEVQVWTGGGHGINGSAADTGVWNVGFRYGWVLTNPIAPGPLKGRFEFAVDAVPVFVVFQKTGPTYGFGLNPFALKWNFVQHHSISPYVDIGGGSHSHRRCFIACTERTNSHGSRKNRNQSHCDPNKLHLPPRFL